MASGIQYILPSNDMQADMHKAEGATIVTEINRWAQRKTGIMLHSPVIFLRYAGRLFTPISNNPDAESISGLREEELPTALIID